MGPFVDNQEKKEKPKKEGQGLAGKCSDQKRSKQSRDDCRETELHKKLLINSGTEPNKARCCPGYVKDCHDSEGCFNIKDKGC
jgi:hypothetical protein